MRLGIALLGLVASIGAQAQTPAVTPVKAQLVVHADRPGPVIDRNIYGQFVEHLGRGVYEGIWVGPDSPIPNVRGIRSDVVAALRRIRVPVIRWPGGCFADTYHWRDGIGRREERPGGINQAWGNQPETNAFGTHEFMDFLGQIGAEPFASVNVGSGSVREGDDWMRYMTAPAETDPGRERTGNGHAEPWALQYIGVGNEPWGCGGNMTADTYAATFRQYAAALRTYSGPHARLIAAGADTDDYAWTETMMQRAMLWRPNPTPLAYTTDEPLMWGLSVHFYTFAGNDWYAKGRNVGYDESDWAKALQRANLIDEIVSRHAAIMDRYDPGKKVALVVDEWGAWFYSEKDAPSALYQESTLRDALIAGMSLNIFNRHADRVRMANLAQMVNVIQSLILTRGSEMAVTPTYHVFDMYKVHQDATGIPVDTSVPDYLHAGAKVPGLSVSASRDKEGRLHLSVVNPDPERAVAVEADIVGPHGTKASAETLTASRIDEHVQFGKADPFLPSALSGVRLDGKRLTVRVPAKSVTMIEIGGQRDHGGKR